MRLASVIFSLTILFPGVRRVLLRLSLKIKARLFSQGPGRLGVAEQSNSQGLALLKAPIPGDPQVSPGPSADTGFRPRNL
jgi:hypothetical protein